MSQIIPQFDPSIPTTNQSFSARLVNGGWLMLINESAIGLQLLFSSGAKKLVPAFCLRVMKLDPNLDNVQWTVAYTIPGGAPVSLVTGEALEPTEWTAGEVLLNLTRLTNIGNSVPVSTSTSQVINDGNVAGTQVLEATPSGGVGSSALIKNDGSGVLSGGALTFDAAGNITAVGAVTGGPFHGTADGATQVPAAGVQAGTLGSGVAQTKLSSDGGALISDGLGSLTAAHFNGPIHGQFGNSAWNGQSQTSGAGSGTFSHALGAVPNFYAVTCNTVNSSQTQGIDTLTSTTVHITSGAGLSFFAWLSRAI